MAMFTEVMRPSNEPSLILKRRATLSYLVKRTVEL